MLTLSNQVGTSEFISTTPLSSIAVRGLGLSNFVRLHQSVYIFLLACGSMLISLCQLLA